MPLASRIRVIGAALCASIFLQTACDLGTNLGSSGRVASDLTCRAKDDRADLAWTPVAGAAQYRVWRAVGSGALAAQQTTAATLLADTGLTLDARYRWQIQALDPAGNEVAASNACEAVAVADPGGPSGPPAVDDLVCRPKSEKVDLAWTPVAGAVRYEIWRGTAGGPRALIATATQASFADVGLASGTQYDYAVRALAQNDVASPDSNLCSATPRPRDVTGTPPATPANLVCRAKDGKADITWSPVSGVAYYQLTRVGNGASGVIAQTTRTLYADFGLVNLRPYQYRVEAVGPGGLVSAASTACSVVSRPRDPASAGNRAPGFSSTPTTTVREQFLWWYDAEATDPDGDPVSFELVSAPPGATFDAATGLVSFTPTPAQIGDHVLEIAAHDGRGASARQTFVLHVEDVNRAPRITSIPAATAKVGSEYLYTIDVYDPDGDPVALDFESPPPSGVALDAATSTLRWTPTDPQVGPQTIPLRARDPAGAAALQTIDVTVTRTPLDLLEPTGSVTMNVGEILRIPVRANHAAARLGVKPLPPHAELHGGTFAFRPHADQAGEILVTFEARLGEELDNEPFTIIVRKPNAGPVLTVPPAASVDEGAPLRVPVSASDADGDLVTITAPGLSLPNAYFDQVAGELVFSPDFTQAGSYPVQFAASDGTASTTATLTITVNDATPSQPLDLVVDPPQTPTFLGTQTIRGSIVGQAGSGAPPPAALVTGLAPSGVKQGRSASVVLDVSNMTLAAGATSADFGTGITVTQLDVLSPTQARVTVQAAADAALGPRGVVLSSNGVDAPAIIAFLVEPGAAQVSGTVVDPFTQQPLASARVKVNGSTVEATTDAQGRFVLDGVPPGAQQIVVVLPNYALQQIDVSVGANADVALPDPVELTALARPFSAGGSLPRAARLASLIDRNVGSRNGGMDQQQAEALIQDTLVVVGGNEIGVRDDVGNQLNPNAPPEASSVMPAAVRAQATRLVEGHVMSLGDILRAIILTFDWRGSQPSVDELLQDFQPIVEAAWANPQNPESAMPIVLFNQGATLTTRAPLLTAETPINHFQAFLLCTSFLVKNRATLSESIDALLRAKNIDPDGIIADPTTIPEEVTRHAPGAGARAVALQALESALDGSLGLVFGRDAWAASSQVVVDPNQFDRSFTGRTFTKIWENTKKAAWAEAVYGGLLAAGTAAAGAILTGAIAGSPAGVAGVTIGATIGLALFDTAISILFQKILVGLFLAATLQQLEPVPPLPSTAFVEGDKLIVRFSPSTTELANQVTGTTGKVKGLGIKPEYLKYTYELLKFPDMKTTDFSKAQRIFGQLEPVPVKAGSPKTSDLQFVVSKAKALTPGPNYFRVVTLQFISAAQVNDRVKWSFQYREDNNDPEFPHVSDLVSDIKVQPEPQVDAAMKALQGHKYSLKFQAHVSAIADANDLTWYEVKSNMEARANVDLAVEQFVENRQRLRDWRIANGSKLSQAKSSFQLADASGKNPNGFLDPNAPEYKATAAALGDPNGVVPDELALRQSEVAASRLEIDTYSGQVQAFEKNLDRFDLTLEQMKTANPASQFSGVYASFDAQGKPVYISFTVKPDAAGRAEIQDLIDAEKAKVDNATTKIQAAEARIEVEKEGIISDRVGDAERTTELKLRDEDVRLRAEVEKAKVEANDVAQKAEFDRKSHVQLEIDTLDPTGTKSKEGVPPPKFKAEKGFADAIDDASAVFSAVTNVTDTVQSFIEGAQEMVSDVSPVLIYYDTPSPPTAARPIARHPNLNEVDAFLTTKGVNRVNPLPGQDVEVDGKLVSTFPGSDRLLNTASMGFPSDLLANDRERWVYAMNKRSSQYGGRIFRFDATKGWARELAGTVNYYSAWIQFGRPATPVAMAIAHGRNVSTGAITSDLLVADIDFVATPAQHRIVQVPVSFAEVRKDLAGNDVWTHPAYANGQNRERIVGQPYATHPAWNFLDLVEIVGGPEEKSGNVQRHYLANGSTVYVLKQDLLTGNVNVEVLFDVSGRKWSGLAFDDTGNLYVADETAGDVITLSETERLALEATGASFCGNAIHLGTGVGNPVRIAIGQNNRTLVASTEKYGIRTVGPLPVLLENAANYQAIALKGANREYPTIKITQQNCPPMFLIEPSDVDLRNGRLKLRVQTRDPQTLQPAFIELSITLNPFGVTRVKTP